LTEPEDVKHTYAFLLFFFFMQSELKAVGKDKKEQGRFSPTGKRN